MCLKRWLGLLGSVSLLIFVAEESIDKRWLYVRVGAVSRNDIVIYRNFFDIVCAKLGALGSVQGFTRLVALTNSLSFRLLRRRHNLY